MARPSWVFPRTAWRSASWEQFDPDQNYCLGLGMATASLAGALLIIIGPIEPSMGREYIGRVLAITVLGGMGALAVRWWQR